MGQLPLNACDSIRELVSVSLDGELPELDAVRLDAHLAVCEGCRTYAAGAGEAARLLREAPLEELRIPIVLPGRRLAVARKLQVAAAAAALAVTVGLSAAVSTISSSQSRAQVHRSASAAKLRFPEQELRMLERASHARANRANHSRLAL
jgi:predicted anti-sigma-YlaC factor YlaD